MLSLIQVEIPCPGIKIDILGRCLVLGSYCLFGRGTFWTGGSSFMMIFWAVIIIAGAYLLFKHFSENRSIVQETSSQGKGAYYDREKSQDPLVIAEERYAKGEITQEEFEKIKDNLSG